MGIRCSSRLNCKRRSKKGARPHLTVFDTHHADSGSGQKNRVLRRPKAGVCFLFPRIVDLLHRFSFLHLIPIPRQKWSGLVVDSQKERACSVFVGTGSDGFCIIVGKGVKGSSLCAKRRLKTPARVVSLTGASRANPKHHLNSPLLFGIRCDLHRTPFFVRYLAWPCIGEISRQA